MVAEGKGDRELSAWLNWRGHVESREGASVHTRGPLGSKFTRGHLQPEQQPLHPRRPPVQLPLTKALMTTLLHAGCEGFHLGLQDEGNQGK